MRTCIQRRSIAGVDLAEVWTVLEHPESWPGVVPGIVSVTRVDRVDDLARSEWEVAVGRSVLWWTGTETYRREAGRVDFRALDGDLEHLDGSWEVVATDLGVDLAITLRFEVGIPALQERVDRVAEQLVGDALEGMARGIAVLAGAVEG